MSLASKKSISITEVGEDDPAVEKIGMTNALLEYLAQNPVWGRSDYSDLPGARKNSQSQWRSFAEYPRHPNRPSVSPRRIASFTDEQRRKNEEAKKRQQHRREEIIRLRDEKRAKRKAQQRERRRQQEILDKFHQGKQVSEEGEGSLNNPGVIISSSPRKSSPARSPWRSSEKKNIKSKIAGQIKRKINFSQSHSSTTNFLDLKANGKVSETDVPEAVSTTSSSKPLKDLADPSEMTDLELSHVEKVIDDVVNAPSPSSTDGFDYDLFDLNSPLFTQDARPANPDSHEGDPVLDNTVSSSSHEATSLKMSLVKSVVTKNDDEKSKDGSSWSVISTTTPEVADADSSTPQPLKMQTRKRKKISYAEMLDDVTEEPDYIPAKQSKTSGRIIKPVERVLEKAIVDASMAKSQKRKANSGTNKNESNLESEQVSSSIAESDGKKDPRSPEDFKKGSLQRKNTGQNSFSNKDFESSPLSIQVASQFPTRPPLQQAFHLLSPGANLYMPQNRSPFLPHNLFPGNLPLPPPLTTGLYPFQNPLLTPPLVNHNIWQNPVLSPQHNHNNIVPASSLQNFPLPPHSDNSACHTFQPVVSSGNNSIEPLPGSLNHLNSTGEQAKIHPNTTRVPHFSMSSSATCLPQYSRTAGKNTTTVENSSSTHQDPSSKQSVLSFLQSKEEMTKNSTEGKYPAKTSPKESSSVPPNFLLSSPCKGPVPRLNNKNHKSLTDTPKQIPVSDAFLHTSHDVNDILSHRTHSKDSSNIPSVVSVTLKDHLPKESSSINDTLSDKFLPQSSKQHLQRTSSHPSTTADSSSGSETLSSREQSQLAVEAMLNSIYSAHKANSEDSKEIVQEQRKSQQAINKSTSAASSIKPTEVVSQSATPAAERSHHVKSAFREPKANMSQNSAMPGHISGERTLYHQPEQISQPSHSGPASDFHSNSDPKQFYTTNQYYISNASPLIPPNMKPPPAHTAMPAISAVQQAPGQHPSVSDGPHSASLHQHSQRTVRPNLISLQTSNCPEKTLPPKHLAGGVNNSRFAAPRLAQSFNYPGPSQPRTGSLHNNPAHAGPYPTRTEAPSSQYNLQQMPPPAHKKIPSSTQNIFQTFTNYDQSGQATLRHAHTNLGANNASQALNANIRLQDQNRNAVSKQHPETACAFTTGGSAAMYAKQQNSLYTGSSPVSAPRQSSISNHPPSGSSIHYHSGGAKNPRPSIRHHFQTTSTGHDIAYQQRVPNPNWQIPQSTPKMPRMALPNRPQNMSKPQTISNLNSKDTNAKTSTWYTVCSAPVVSSLPQAAQSQSRLLEVSQNSNLQALNLIHQTPQRTSEKSKLNSVNICSMTSLPTRSKNDITSASSSGPRLAYDYPLTKTQIKQELFSLSDSSDVSNSGTSQNAEKTSVVASGRSANLFNNPPVTSGIVATSTTTQQGPVSAPVPNTSPASTLPKNPRTVQNQVQPILEKIRIKSEIHSLSSNTDLVTVSSSSQAAALSLQSSSSSAEKEIIPSVSTGVSKIASDGSYLKTNSSVSKRICHVPSTPVTVAATCTHNEVSGQHLSVVNSFQSNSNAGNPKPPKNVTDSAVEGSQSNQVSGTSSILSDSVPLHIKIKQELHNDLSATPVQQAPSLLQTSIAAHPASQYDADTSKSSSRTLNKVPNAGLSGSFTVTVATTMSVSPRVESSLNSSHSSLPVSSVSSKEKTPTNDSSKSILSPDPRLPTHIRIKVEKILQSDHACDDNQPGMSKNVTTCTTGVQAPLTSATSHNTERQPIQTGQRLPDHVLIKGKNVSLANQVTDCELPVNVPVHHTQTSSNPSYTQTTWSASQSHMAPVLRLHGTTQNQTAVSSAKTPVNSPSDTAQTQQNEPGTLTASILRQPSRNLGNLDLRKDTANNSVPNISVSRTITATTSNTTSVTSHAPLKAAQKPDHVQLIKIEQHILSEYLPTKLALNITSDASEKEPHVPCKSPDSETFDSLVAGQGNSVPSTPSTVPSQKMSSSKGSLLNQNAMKTKAVLSDADHMSQNTARSYQTDSQSKDSLAPSTADTTHVSVNPSQVRKEFILAQQNAEIKQTPENSQSLVVGALAEMAKTAKNFPETNLLSDISDKANDIHHGGTESVHLPKDSMTSQSSTRYDGSNDKFKGSSRTNTFLQAEQPQVVSASSSERLLGNISDSWPSIVSESKTVKNSEPKTEIQCDKNEPPRLASEPKALVKSAPNDTSPSYKMIHLESESQKISPVLSRNLAVVVPPPVPVDPSKSKPANSLYAPTPSRTNPTRDDLLFAWHTTPPEPVDSFLFQNFAESSKDKPTTLNTSQSIPSCSSNNLYTVTISVPSSESNNLLQVPQADPVDLSVVKEEFGSQSVALNLREVIDLSLSDDEGDTPEIQNPLPISDSSVKREVISVYSTSTDPIVVDDDSSEESEEPSQSLDANVLATTSEPLQYSVSARVLGEDPEVSFIDESKPIIGPFREMTPDSDTEVMNKDGLSGTEPPINSSKSNFSTTQDNPNPEMAIRKTESETKSINTSSQAFNQNEEQNQADDDAISIASSESSTHSRTLSKIPAPLNEQAPVRCSSRGSSVSSVSKPLFSPVQGASTYAVGQLSPAGSVGSSVISLSHSVDHTLASIASWTKEKVLEWLTKHKLDKICPNLSNLDGNGLQRMAFEYVHDPDVFYTRVKKTLGLTLFQTLVICRSMKELTDTENEDC